MGHLLAQRGRTVDQNEGAVNTTVRVRYGAREPVNALLSDQTPRCALAKDRG